MNDPKTPVPNSQHPQAKAIGKNKFNKAAAEKHPLTKALDDIAALKNEKPAPVAAVIPPPKPVAPSPAPKSPSFPGKDLKRFEITVSINGSSEPPFVVDVALTGNGPADQAAARALAKKKFPGRAMTVISSRIFTITENALTEIAPGSTLSSLFGATGGTTEDLIEIGRAFHDGSRGTIFLRNLRTSVGVTFRPSTGGLIVFSNRIASNRLASELPMIISEVLGRGAREIQIYLKS